MWKPWTALVGWAGASNQRAIANARSAATDCSRRRVERTEVDLYLSARAESRTVVEHLA